MNVLYQGISRWSWMPQRPQQLLRAAARAGHRCWFVERPERPGDDCLWSPEPGVHVCANLSTAQSAAGEAYLYYFTDPTLADRLAELRRGPVLFDALDDFPGLEAQVVRAARAADRVICTSHTIMASLSPVRPDLLYVPNACDFSHWSAAPGRVPGDAAALRRPLA